MKEKLSAAAAALLVIGVLLLLSPFILLYFLFKVLITPYDYYKHKKNRYQKDFPKRYSWLKGPHPDSLPYGAIKEAELPIDYIKWSEAYDLHGYFVYQDILLVFHEPLFFDQTKGLWLWWQGPDNAEELVEDEDEDEESDEDYASVEELRAFLLNDFHDRIAGRVCRRVVFFYEKKRLKKRCEAGGLEAMQALDDFVIYDKGALSEALKAFVEENIKKHC
ncbi:MAG: hypothetical protein J6S34_00745 [Clostridia bacterium]|nr:hypothetical protein [Clostridia bacterium]